ncbi:sterol desaturase family protein [Mucilaginibacter limnophilus]|uniref:Sterol desaturase family protein n=1 Tax=Mucilaginibacter limnophilus TaxID=1932778 RepID=A0A437MV13_9SPHI|nr:sterol desaturase family protein [Mucilaginibacter limnophilus]RVU01512.1 sterol desaturase family protein [Mucilaginibacter limnophilus]
MEQLSAVYFKLLSLTLARYFIIAGVFFILYYVFKPARAFKNKIQTRYAQKKDFLREIGHSVQTSFILAGVGVFALFLSAKGYTKVYHQLTTADWWYVPLSLAISLIIHDTYFYWMHRVLHHPAVFKYAHLVHHKSTTPSPWAAYSFHILEAVAEGLVLLIIVLVLPVHKLTIALFILFGFIINVYGHLGYEIAPRRFRNSILFEIFNSSVYHNLHHSKFRGNYGLYFRLWDRLMKTENPDYVKEYDKIQAKRFESRVEQGRNLPLLQ